MKNILVAVLFAGSMIACRKHGSLSTVDNGTQLTAIYSDSSGALNFGYTGNIITSIGPNDSLADTILEKTYGTQASIQYSTVGAVPYVSIFFVPDDYVIRYSLTPSKLPLEIDLGFYSGSSIQYSDEVNFVYFPGTDVLDSVIDGERYPNPIIFKFIYSGQNITQINEISPSAYGNDTIGIYSLTYGNTPNVFRHTDSLLYIYSYPASVFELQPELITAFFAETFSTATFNSLTTGGILGGQWNGEAYSSFSSHMTYTLNADGKVTAEIFDSFFNNIAGKRYYYK